MRKATISMFSAGLVGFLALATIKTSSPRRLLAEVCKRAHVAEYVDHAHEAVMHMHAHPHVTHNRREGADEVLGEWEHLTALHTHEHNHAAIRHSHLPHTDAEHEHLGEGHIHDHSHPSES